MVLMSFTKSSTWVKSSCRNYLVAKERNKEIFTFMQWMCSKLSPSSPQSTTWNAALTAI